MAAHLTLIGADKALAEGYKGTGVTIGLLDTGVRRDHPTLNGRVAANFVNISASGNDLSVDDKSGHGTTVAQLAAGAAFGQWPGGVAQGANIVSSRIINDTPPKDDGSGQGNEIRPGQGYGPSFKALNLQLADAGANIINNSWGGLYWSDPAMTRELVDAYSDFILNRDGLVVFANGNAGTDSRYRANPSDNAALPSKSSEAAFLERGWITVGALNPTEATPTLTDYSQACGVAMRYCVVAPGNVTYTGLNDTAASPTYAWGGGTSYAAPLVSGTAALVWGAFPYFNNDLVRQTVLGTATDIGDAGVDAVFGYGLLNAAAAVKGPGRFDWGDVIVEFENTLDDDPDGDGLTYWRNPISGSGGLTKDGAGTLVLTERSSYSGTTRVVQGGVVSLGGLANSSVVVDPLATFQGVGNFGGDVTNAGLVIAGSGEKAMNIAGNFTNFTGEGVGTLAIWLGDPLGVDKQAVIGNDTVKSKLKIEGIRTGYTVKENERQVVIYTKEGLKGAFDDVVLTAPNVTLVNYSLQYDLLNAYLHAERVNVATAASAWGLSAMSQGVALQVENAMRAIDGQLASGVGGISSGFIGAVGEFQNAQGVAGVDMSLRSLSGQLHGTAAALTFDSIDANRRVAAKRFDRFRGNLKAAGSWASDVALDSGLAMAGFDAVGISSNGQMVGHDLAFGQNTLVGVAVSRQQQQSWLPSMGDRLRGYQYEGQVYTAWLDDGFYAQGRLGVGEFDREMQRNLLLGSSAHAVGTRLTGSYVNVNAESGYSVDIGAGRVTPYAGMDYTELDNDGFSEIGADGMGLRAAAWRSNRTNAYAGLRAEQDWDLGQGVRLSLDARGEWQQRVAGQGEVFNVSFSGYEQWQPLYGIGLATQSSLYQFGLNTSWARRNLFRLDYSVRQSDRFDDQQVSLQYRRVF